MLFSSLEFLYLFLPLVLGVYFLCPMRLRNVWLLTASLFFYGFGEPVYVFLMITTILADYGFGLAIERSSRRKRLWLMAAVMFNLSLLGFFKYYDLFARLLGLPTLNVSLPIGISFYTFQALSYVIDVYRSEVTAEVNPVAFGTYVSLFPQLIAGPIVKYSDVSKELKDRRHSLDHIAEGAARFSEGLAKKVLLANGAGELSETLWERSDSVGALWLGLIFYSFQIYYDFSGYSDMAIGLGRILGFGFPENFNYPYISKSITEFWRRWHITLSSWFRDYLYIPLGGNRRGRARTYLNLFIVWSLTGLWHGAAVNFVLWGIYFFLLLCVEKAFLLKLLNKLPSFIGHAYAILFILIGWLIFSADGDMGQTLTRWLSMIGFGELPAYNSGLLYELVRNLPYALIMILGATPLPRRIFERLRKKSPLWGLTLRNILTLGSLLLCTAYLVSSGYNPFLYFRF